MKRILCICLSLCALSATALAASADGVPPRWAFATEAEWREAAAQAAASEPEPTLPPESSQSIESAGVKNGNPPSLRMDSHSDEKYPTGSFIDAAGRVWSPSGELLSPDAVPAAEAAAEDTLPSGVLDHQGSAAPFSVEDPDTLAVIADLVSDIATDPPVWYVKDLRPADAPVEVLDGLKALVTSIFGAYTPVTTTSVVTETVGNDTHQYLVETVAPGAAGVDYEWLAGVFLFGILLFCLMKLLGGVIS